MLAASFVTSNAIATSSFGIAASGSDFSRRDFLKIGAVGLGSLLITGCGDNTMSGTTDAGTGGDTGTDGGTFTPPTSFSLQTLVDGALACEFTADLDNGVSAVLGVCTPPATAGNPNQIFSLDPDASPLPTSPATNRDFGDLGTRTLNQLAELVAGRAVVTSDDFNSGGASGLFAFNIDGTGAHDALIEFPAEYNFGGGAILIGSKLFVPTANFNPDFTYNAGTVLVYDVNDAGAIDEGSLRVINTTGVNTTGTAQIDDNTLLVLNSGDFSPEAQAILDIIDVSTEEVIDSIPLGNLTAQPGGEIALSSDRTQAIIGTGDSSGQVLIVDLVAKEVQSLAVDGDNFHSSVQVDGNLAYVTDFGGLVNVIDMINAALITSVPLETGNAGPSAVFDGRLIQVAGASVYIVTPEYE